MCVSSLVLASNVIKNGVSLHFGIGDRYKSITLNYETAPLWSYQFKNRFGRVDLVPELGVSYWWAKNSSDNVWQVNAIPMFRWWAIDNFYLEAGIGATLFSKIHFTNKNIGTNYQFGDHIGIGYLFAQNHRFGVRYSHFSNAGIKKPNPGLDLVQLTYTYQF